MQKTFLKFINNYKIKKNFPHLNSFVSEMFVFLFFLTFTLYYAHQREFPYIFEDEYGALGAAAFFAGYHWTTPPGMPFYGFILSLFSAPLYLLNLDPTTLYRAVLSINGFLVALSAVLALRTIRMFGEQYSELLRVGTVVAAFSYPSVLHYSWLAMGETVLLFSLSLITYCLVALTAPEKRNYFFAFLLGIGLGLAPYAHPRGMAFCLAIIPIFVFAVKARWIELKPAIVVTLFTLLTAGVLSFVKNYLVDNFYTHALASSISAGKFIASRISLLSFEQWGIILRIAIGQFTYLMTSSFGLVLIGTGTIAYVLNKIIKLKMKDPLQIDNELKKQATAAAFIAMACILMFSVSVLQFGNPTRTDQFFYGRYNEVLMPSLIAATCLAFGYVSRFKGFLWMLSSLFFAVTLVFTIMFYPEDLFNRPIGWASVTSWFIHVQGPWIIQPPRILLGSLMGGLILVVAFGFSRPLFFVFIIVFFVSVALHNFEGQHRTANIEWGKYAEIGKSIGSLFSGQTIAVIGDISPQYSRIRGEALQIAFPKAYVRFGRQDATNADAIFESTGQYCDDVNTIVSSLDRMRLRVLHEDLRRTIVSAGLPSMDGRSARNFPPASFVIDDLSMETTFETGGILPRTLALASKYFYLSWAKHFLPSFRLKIFREGLTGNERQTLGLFIKDNNGNWLYEWRVSFNTKALARRNSISLRVPVRFKARMPAGQYKLTMAIFDDKGWDWRSVKTVQLILK